MKHFKFYHKQDILSFTKIGDLRPNWAKVWQAPEDIGNLDSVLAQSNARYVLFGIPEDYRGQGKLREPEAPILSGLLF